jgi:hypothetical protein
MRARPKGWQFLLGKPLPYTLEFLAGIFEDFLRWVDDLLHDPGAVEKEIRRREEEFQGERRRRMIRASEEAAQDGRRLLEMRALNGPFGWPALLARLHVSPKTALNLMALALFAKRHPETFERFRHLGPSKLYRMARLRRELQPKLEADYRLELTRGPVAVRQLTDGELEKHLERLDPRPPKTEWEKLERAVAKTQRLALRAARDEVESARGDLVETMMGATLETVRRRRSTSRDQPPP